MWKEFLDDVADGWLPDKMTRWILAATPVTAGLGLKLPDLLQTLGASIHNSAILPYRYTGLFSLLSLGLSLALLRTAFYNRSQKLLLDQVTDSNDAKKQSQKFQADSLDETKKRILARLARGAVSAKSLTRDIGITSETLTYNLEQMSELIRGRVDAWDDRLRLTKAGRQVAVELGLLDAG